MERFLIVGGLLCLDLVNTEPVLDGARADLLPGFPDLVHWLRAAGALPDPAAQRALARWGGTAEASAAWREAIELRAALRAGAERMAEGKAPGPGMARAVNRVLALTPSYPRLVREGGRYITRNEPIADSALRLLAPVAESAAWLLEHGDLSRVRRCDGERCVLLFYDGTKNGSRRWCSMEGCGSRAKAAAYYRRTHGRPTQPPHPRGH